MTLRDWGSLLIIASAAGSWVFCAAYTFLAPWWKKPTGRQVFLQAAALGLVLTVWSIGLLTEAGNAHWFQVLRLVAFVPVPIAIWGQLILLLNVNRIAWRDLRRDR
jgi:hypothetical protein